jgi:diguanylate cyclase (GGDEF)-like protein
MTTRRKLILGGLALMVLAVATGTLSAWLTGRALAHQAGDEAAAMRRNGVPAGAEAARATVEASERTMAERSVFAIVASTTVVFGTAALGGARLADRRARLRSGAQLSVLTVAFDRMAEALAADAERRHQVEAQLEREASQDHLTGLPNRRSLERVISTALASPTATPATVAVLFLDVDEFMAVNDELGHGAGDELLQCVAGRLAAELRPGDVLARFGGDEFVAVCRDLAEPTDAERVAARFQRALGAVVEVAGHELYVSVSVGIALNDAESTAESLVRDADAAMNRAKAEGRRRHVTHDAAIAALAATRLTDSADLRRAVTHGDLVLEYQPLVDLTTLEVISYEALVRWQRDGRLLQPASFIGRAEELGLARTLDQWVLGDACRQMARWRDEDHPHHVAINVSTATLGDLDLAGAILSELAAHSISPTLLTLEIIEGLLVAAPDQVIETLWVLRAHGVRVAIDDFGTGHSSLARLRDLPVDVLKVDRTFVSDVETDPSRRAILSTMVELGLTLGLDVVAEGVETPGQHEILRALGCLFGQGYLFGHPRRAAEVTADLGRTA